MHPYITTCTPTRYKHTKQEEGEQQDGIKEREQHKEQDKEQRDGE